MEIKEYIENLCRSAKAASRTLAPQSTAQKNTVLARIASLLRENKEKILAANAADLSNAGENGVPATMLDRLKLDSARIDGMASALNELVLLSDPVGSGERQVRPNGLIISKIRVPLGVVAIIYEARPNVTVDAAALCIKTGNAVILRGGKEAICTNRILSELMKQALGENGISPDAVSLVDDTSREGTRELMQMRQYVDVLIPRGSRGLIKSVIENSKIPAIETGAGNCHLYVDSTADLDMALKIAVNAKMQRPSVCNAIETLLVHRDIARQFLPRFYSATRDKSLSIRGDAEVCEILPDAVPAADDDWETEYNDYIIAAHIVTNTDEAIEHINRYGTGHSEAIVTETPSSARLFCDTVDAAAVYVNASTRFTDGGEFGYGAEIGISTQKLHARGPMGLYELTCTKYLVDGNGQIR